ncbi:MAG TPA: hypothetical protein VHY58_17865 [Streptosporangiaceae bacterium]|nr:hypothetical protein [Streptosporangiaceae bacterium]
MSITRDEYRCTHPAGKVIGIMDDTVSWGSSRRPASRCTFAR